MYRPTLKSIWSLAALALISIVLYYISQNSYSEIRAEGYEQKIEAGKHMKACMEVLREEFDARGYIIDTTNDPNQTGLIGLSGSSITTSRGILSDKLTGLNPNFAAVFVDMFLSARVRPGDYIAVGQTSANPGLNLALYSAMHTLELNPVVITSVGSSMFGANREDFTWLDMENILRERGLINFSSVAASIGGGSDIGRGLPLDGRNLIIENIEHHEIILIHNNDLQGNIRERMEIYDDLIPNRQRYRLFVNIGGGLANVGASVNASLIRDGINYRIADRTFATDGAIMLFARRNIPIIHIFRPQVVAERYGLVVDPIPLPEVGTGKVFISEVNNTTVAAICLGILLLCLIVVIIFDRYDRHFTTNIIDPDQELI
ncbi:MAG: poly-gamma-glutamate system protein [Candidatus Cloacimonetes bacterium]|nr:poly-gamma-glutamate system protein [Candidatus Cloacimonadota bacterium]